MNSEPGPERRRARMLISVPLLLLATALAATSVGHALGGGDSVAAAIAGAWAGVLFGTGMGVSRVRLLLVLAALAGFAALVWLAFGTVLASEFVPRALGPGRTLAITAALRFGATAFIAVTFLRLISTRHPALSVVELFVLAFAMEAAFASHRDGVIARPLWLADWAWRAGMEPTRVLLGIGLAIVVVLGALLVAQRSQSRGFSALILLLALGLMSTFTLSVTGPPKPGPLSDLGLADDGEGDPPRPPDGGSALETGSIEPADQRWPPPPSGHDERGADAAAEAAAEAGRGAPDAGGATDAGQSGDASGQNPVVPPDRPDSDSPPTPNPRPAAVIILENDYSPPSEAYYFRQEALSQYNGRRLVKTARGDVDRDILASFPASRSAVVDAPSESGRKLVRARVALLIDHPQPFALETPREVSPLANPNPSTFVRAYRFEALAQSAPFETLAGRRAGDPRWSAELREHYLGYPPDPRYGELARQIIDRLPPSQRGDPFARALAVKVFLDRYLVYSQRERHAGAPDPAADMLFGNRTGYCVHFAHAAVYLWRSLGIPSRVGAGYMSEESKRHGSSTILLWSSDSHAWPELYLEGIGFVVLDIHPARVLDKPSSPPDEDLQRLLGEMARQEPPDPSVTEAPPSDAIGAARWRGPALAGLVGAGFLALIVLYLVKLWRALCPLFVSGRALPRVAYRAALDHLSELGLSREEGETREAFARRVERLAPSFGGLTALHLGARFGDPGRGLPPELRAGNLNAALRAVRRELRGSTPPWRRWLGLANPLSFVSTR